MADLSEALVDRTMAIAMPSGLHVPAVVNRSVSSTAGPPLRNRGLWKSGRTMISREPVASISIDSSVGRCYH